MTDTDPLLPNDANDAATTAVPVIQSLPQAAPLLADLEPQQPTKANKRCNQFLNRIELILAKIDIVMLAVSSCFTGQLFCYAKNWTFRNVLFCITVVAPLLFMISINVAPAGFVLYSWRNGSVNVFNVTYLLNVENVTNNEVPQIVLRDLTTKSIKTHSLSNQQITEKLNEFEPYAKLVITFFTLSSGFSFVVFIHALVCTYKCGWWRKCTQRNYEDIEFGDRRNQFKVEREPLNPFSNDEKDETSTRLYLPESLYFCLLLSANLIILSVCVIFFVIWHYFKSYYDSHIAIGVEGAVFGMYMYSLLCTIVSCFIFSKIAYSVTHRCMKLYENYEKGDSLHELLEKDDLFISTAQVTLRHFEFWFTVHWIFYTVTSFLSVTLFFDILTNYIQSTSNESSAIGFSGEELGIIAMFTVQHCFLFLYPCFKAAAVTVGREKLIKKINTDRQKLLLDQNKALNREEKLFLIQYLKNKKFGFRISFFCARLRFGFNVAYISIFIGLLGVLLKLTGVF